jgi:hypothetical protein
MNKLLRITALLGVLTGAFAFSGCIAAIGNGPTPHSRPGVTLGQELIDLQKARDAGTLTEEEYQAQRGRLLGTRR